jgi:hypothetical protein
VWGAPAGTNAYPVFPGGNMSGIYRLEFAAVVTHYHDVGEGFGDPVAEEFRTSNTFNVVDDTLLFLSGQT